MSNRFWFKPSDVSEDQRIFFQCKSCRETRGIGRLELIAKAGDIPMRDIERRIRCQQRLRKPGRPICGGRGEFELLPIVNRERVKALMYQQRTGHGP